MFPFFNKIKSILISKYFLYFSCTLKQKNDQIFFLYKFY